MKEAKMKLKSNLVVNYPPGSDVDVIVHKGQVYVSAFPAFGDSEEDAADDAPPKKAAKEPAPSKEVADTKPKKGAAKPAVSDEEEDEVTTKVKTALTRLDTGDANAVKTISTIANLTEDADEAKPKVKKVIDAYTADDDAEPEEYVKKLVAIVNGEEVEEKPKKAAAPKKGAGSKAAPKEISFDDLEVGDEVEVWWGEDDDNEYNAWYKGTVESIKKGVIKITYEEDGETVAVDENVHTKVRRA